MTPTLSPAGVFTFYLNRVGESQHRFPLFDLALRVGLLVKGVFATLAALLANLFDLTTHLEPKPQRPVPSPGMVDFADDVSRILNQRGFKDPNLRNDLVASFIAYRDTTLPRDLASVQHLVVSLRDVDGVRASQLARFLGYTIETNFGVTTYTAIRPLVPAPARQ